MKNVLKSIGLVVLNLLLQFIVQSVFAMIGMAGGMEDETALNAWLMDRILVATIISNLLFVLAMVLIYKIKKVNIKEEWKVNTACAGTYVMPCVIAFTYSMFYSLLTYDAVANAAAPTHVSASHYGTWGIWILALALLIFAPITEEIMCRGLMMNLLKKSFSAKVAILGSSAIFGIIHILAGGISLAIGAFIMGVLLAIIYEKTGSLYVVIIAHGVANLPEFILYSSPEIKPVARILMTIGFLLISVGCLEKWWKMDVRVEN